MATPHIVPRANEEGGIGLTGLRWGDSFLKGLTITNDITIGDDLFLSSDSAVLNIGAGNDFKITHDGTDGATISSAGTLNVQVSGANDDIVFKADNGASSLMTYLTIDGSAQENSLTAKTRFGVNDTGVDVIIHSDTSLRYALFDTSRDALVLADNYKLEFGTDSDSYVQFNGSVTEFGGDSFTFTSANANDPIFTIQNTRADANPARFVLGKFRGGSSDGVDGDDVGSILFNSFDDGTPSLTTYANMLVEIDDATSGEESGKLSLKVAAHDAGLEDGLVLTGGSADAEVDVTVGNGAASVTTIAGTLTMGSTATLDNSGVLQVAGQTNITSVGTLTALTVDDIGLDGKTLTITGDTDDTFTIVTGAGGATTLTTTDTAAAAGHFEVAADGNITLDAAGDIALEAGGGDITADANITPSSSDGAALGSTSNMWSDLFLASGGVVNFDNGNVTLTHSSNRLTLADSDELAFGTGNDLRILHNATNSYIENHGGDLEIQQLVDNQNIIFKCDNGSGGIATYMTIDGLNERIVINRPLVVDTAATNTVGGGFDGAETVRIKTQELNNEIVTTILIDLGTGGSADIVASATDGDVIGESGVAAAFITKLSEALNGVLYHAEMICLETPVGANTDINVVLNSTSLAQDALATAEGHIIINNGAQAIGKFSTGDTTGIEAAAGANNDYIYLANGAGGAGGTYSAGKFMIRLYGCNSSIA